MALSEKAADDDAPGCGGDAPPQGSFQQGEPEVVEGRPHSVDPLQQREFVAAVWRGSITGLVNQVLEQIDAESARHLAFEGRNTKIGVAYRDRIEKPGVVADADDAVVQVGLEFQFYGAVALLAAMHDDVGDGLVNSQNQFAGPLLVETGESGACFDEIANLLQVIEIGGDLEVLGPGHRSRIRVNSKRLDGFVQVAVDAELLIEPEGLHYAADGIRRIQEHHFAHVAARSRHLDLA